MPAKASQQVTDPLRSWMKLRSQLANAIRDDAPAERVADLRRQYALARYETLLRSGLADLEPLDRETRARLAAILTEPKRKRLAS